MSLAKSKTSKLKKKIKEVKRKLERLHCPISQEIMKNPVLAKDGHTYEKEVIMDWISRNSTSPFTREVLNMNELTPNFAVRDEVEELTFKLRQLEEKYKQLNK